MCRTKAGVHYWEQVRAKLESVFKHIFALRRAHRIRHEGLMVVLAFLESCSRKSWEIPRFDRTSLYAPVSNPKLEALAKKIGTKDDPIQIAAQLAAKVAVMEKKNEVLEKRLAAQSNATPDGYEALKTKLANLGTDMTALQGKVGNLRKDGKGDRGGKGEPPYKAARTANTTARGDPICKKYNDVRGCPPPCPDRKKHVCDAMLPNGKVCGNPGHAAVVL